MLHAHTCSPTRAHVQAFLRFLFVNFHRLFSRLSMKRALRYPGMFAHNYMNINEKVAKVHT